MGQRPRRDREKRAGLPPSGERVRSENFEETNHQKHKPMRLVRLGRQ